MMQIDGRRQMRTRTMLVLAAFTISSAASGRSLEDCKKITGAIERLDCFDKLPASEAPSPPQSPTQPGAAPTSAKPRPSADEQRIAIQEGRWDEAIRLSTQAIAAPGASNADLAEAHNHRGYAYFGKGQTDQAIADYTAAIRLDPNDADPHGLRGWAHFTQGAMKEAIADSTTAIRLDPNSAFAYRNRGRAQLYAGQARPAADNFAAAVKVAPSDVP